MLEDAEDEHANGAIVRFLIFDTSMQKCRNMQYACIASLKIEIVSKVKEVEHLDLMNGSKIMKMEDFKNRVKDCRHVDHPLLADQEK